MLRHVGGVHVCPTCIIHRVHPLQLRDHLPVQPLPAVPQLRHPSHLQEQQGHPRHDRGVPGVAQTVLPGTVRLRRPGGDWLGDGKGVIYIRMVMLSHIRYPSVFRVLPSL